MEILFSLGVVAFFLVLGLVFGQMNRSKHLAALEKREAEHADFALTNMPSFPGGVLSGCLPQLVSGEAVIASDYLKTFLSGWRKFFGGSMRSYEDLEVRARREAILRLIEASKKAGYNAACNLRLESVDIAGCTNKKDALPMATFTAYATGYTMQE